MSLLHTVAPKTEKCFITSGKGTEQRCFFVKNARKNTKFRIFQKTDLRRDCSASNGFIHAGHVFEPIRMDRIDRHVFRTGGY